MAISKAKAKKMAYENESTTYGELLDMLDNVDMSKPSKVNPSIPKDMVISIMRDCWGDKDRNAVVKTTQVNYRGKLILTTNGINMQNILREAG